VINNHSDGKGLRIVVSFVDDFVTQSAFVGQFFLKKPSPGNKVIRLPAKLNRWNRGGPFVFKYYSEDRREGAVEAMIDEIEHIFKRKPGHFLKRLEITGHGYPACWVGRLSFEDLIPETSSKRAALERLRPLWDASNDGLILRMCSVAKDEEGRLFLKELAKTVGANVTGWTGIYEIHPTGEEWTANPNGVVTKIGDTGRISYFGPWKDRPLLKKILTFPTLLALMAWRTITGK
jgi:hypothetical protein